jgi:excisionase family DNA binding protein
MEEIITASDVASLLQVHLKTVYRLARSGLIPGRKFGGGWRFSKEEILRMVSTGIPREPSENPAGEKAA